MQALNVDALFQELVKDNRDLVAALVVDGAGRVHTSDSLAPDVARAAVALAVPAREILDRVSAELGCGALRSVLLEGDRASLAFADVDGATTAVVVGATGASPGALRADALALAARLNETTRLS
jgi:predicted regulator of Ras-like GTPase activity (Roadblock/LC7/MglB family)